MIFIVNNIIIGISILIGAFIWFKIVKLALKNNEKRELEIKKEEKMLSVMTEDERKKYKKAKSIENTKKDIEFSLSMLISELLLSIF